MCNLPVPVKRRLLDLPGQKSQLPEYESSLLLVLEGDEEVAPLVTGEGLVDGDDELNGHFAKDPLTELQESELKQIIGSVVSSIENELPIGDLDEIFAELTDIEKEQINDAVNAARLRIAKEKCEARSA